MGIISWLVFGAIVGWIAGVITGKSRSMGLGMNIIVGILGSVVGGWLGLIAFAFQIYTSHCHQFLIVKENTQFDTGRRIAINGSTHYHILTYDFKAIDNFKIFCRNVGSNIAQNILQTSNNKATIHVCNIRSSAS